MVTYFYFNFGKMHKFWSLGLGVFDEVSVSSRNFNQVPVSKVTVSTISLLIACIQFSAMTHKIGEWMLKNMHIMSTNFA